MKCVRRPVPVFLLAGQSNMAGAGRTAELPGSLSRGPATVRLFEADAWRALAWRDTFGPEIGLAFRLARTLPGIPCVLCKVSLGGSNLYYDWNPDGKAGGPEDSYRGPLYPVLMRAWKGVSALLASAGATCTPAGVFWMQGERDSVFEFMARAYSRNLRRLIGRLRRDLDAPRLPFVMGRIAPRVYNLAQGRFQHAHRERVQKAQDRVARQVPHVAIVRTDDLPQGDNLHYTTGGQLELGYRFAEAWRPMARAGRRSRA